MLILTPSLHSGWVAIYALTGPNALARGESAFGKILKVVAEYGGGQAFASALLLASGICAMMSTADSALLAFSTMWVKDMFKPYIWRKASDMQQLLFG